MLTGGTDPFLLATDLEHRPGTWTQEHPRWGRNWKSITLMSDAELMERFFWVIMARLAIDDHERVRHLSDFRQRSQASIWNETLWALVPLEKQIELMGHIAVVHSLRYPIMGTDSSRGLRDEDIMGVFKP